MTISHSELVTGSTLKLLADYRVIIASTLIRTEHNVPGYQIVNRKTGVVEGEGWLLARVLVWAEQLQAELDAYNDGSYKSGNPLGDDDSGMFH